MHALRRKQLASVASDRKIYISTPIIKRPFGAFALLRGFSYISEITEGVFIFLTKVEGAPLRDSVFPPSSLNSESSERREKKKRNRLINI